MCGITGAIAERNVVPILLEGLKRLEYRGYDSAGIALINDQRDLIRLRQAGKVSQLEQFIDHEATKGSIGIAHTRWATHGEPNETNAHPHMCETEQLALVHNGIIENYEVLKEQLEAKGLSFTSDTDTEVIVHSISQLLDTMSLFDAVKVVVKQLQGAYALVVISKKEPSSMIVARHGSPLVIGLGIGENFVASDPLALLPVTQEFIALEDGDVAKVSRQQVEILDGNGDAVVRERRKSELDISHCSRGSYRHYMHKEIHEQPTSLASALEGRCLEHSISDLVFGLEAAELFDRVAAVHIVACGTSYYAGLVAKHWLESVAGLRAEVDIASELLARDPVIEKNTLFVSLSQSGETADTLSALKRAKNENYCASLTICNVPESAMVRESDFALLTHAGPEIGVASTKAFTAQLTALLMLSACLGRRNCLDKGEEAQIVTLFRSLPSLAASIIEVEPVIQEVATLFEHKKHALFLGRGVHFPIALEGALKLKEISYIHAEAYPAGELKHGPLALVDQDMPVLILIPNDELADKLKSNLQEVLARNGQVLALVAKGISLKPHPNLNIVELPIENNCLSPVLFTIPLQLLAYHVALLKGTDVDQPRNLAKSVTVE